MLEEHFRRPRVCERIRLNPIAEQILEFIEFLDQRGHAPLTIQLYAQAGEHFGRWLGESGNLVISRESVEDFLVNHLPSCCCPTPASHQGHSTRAALHHLLRFQGSSDAEQAVAENPVTQLLTDYDEHLDRNAGLAEATRHYRRRYAQEFLQSMSSGGEVLWESLTPQHVMDFVTTAAPGRKRSSTQVAASSLRCFLRFLQFRGLCGETLIRAVPSIPQWSLSSIPATMTKEQVRSFLDSFDRETATGRRDYAMALCMVEMGLRVSEVVPIETADLDWRQAVLSIRVPKGRRVHQLPLSNRIGQAVAQYLKKGRPKSTWRNVFLRHTIPVGTPVTRELVRGVMRRAYARCGFADSTGTHVLRQTLLGLLASTGLRISEALRLRADEVDWDQQLLIIKETKFYKSRLVPFHPTVAAKLQAYLAVQSQLVLPPKANTLFVSDRGTALKYSTVRGTFCHLCAQLGWKLQRSRPRPRLYDLRHTFACRRLLTWYQEGVEIDHAISSLSTYMGHVHVSDTYWYLTGIPELFRIAAERFKQLASRKETEAQS